MSQEWTVGTRVFCVETKAWGDRPEKGHFLAIDKVTPTRVSAGERTWTRDGEPYGRAAVSSWIRDIRPGDEAMDAAWHARVKAAKIKRDHEASAWKLAGVHGRDWCKLTPEQVEQIHAWLAEVKS